MGSEEGGKLRMYKFDGSDFAFWKTQIEDYLYQNDLYQPRLGVEKEKPKDMSAKNWTVLDRKALGVAAFLFLLKNQDERKDIIRYSEV